MLLPRNLLASLTVAALVVAAVAVLAFPARAASGYTAHNPILIDGDAGFTVANGVTGGNGSTADPYRIEGWSIDASAADGIVVRNTTAAFLVFDVIVYSGGYAYDGIVLDNVTAGVVQNATLTHNANGIVLRDASHLTLLANAVLLNAWNGVDVEHCRDVFLNGNSVSYNRDGLSVQRSVDVRLAGNSVALNNQDGVYLYGVANVSVIGGVIASNGWSGLTLQGGSNATVAANQISSNARLGVSVGGVTGLQILSNALFSNAGGSVQVNSATNVTVTGNNASPAGSSGIVVENAAAVTVARNSVSQANYSGILISHIAGATVGSNVLSNNEVGLGAVNVSDLVITSNIVGTSLAHGVSLIAPRNLTFTGNNVSRNADGIVIDSGVGGVLRGNVFWENGYGVALIRSTGLSVVNNTFLENAPQAFDDSNGSNRWDSGYPAGGNYWSDYGGIDLCRGPNQTVCISPDGIGDTGYFIPTNSADRYPLMRIPGSSPRLPVASFLIAPLEGNTTTLFVFDASSSYDLQDPSGALLVRWDLDGDGIWDTAWTTSRTVTHRFPDAGVYAVRLEVLDLSGLMSDKVQEVRVASLPPPPPPWYVTFLPGLVLLALLGVAAGFVLYRRVQRRRAHMGQPAWRLPLRPRR